MDNPPPLPDPKPLGATFYVLLLAPIVSMGVAAACAHFGGKDGSDFGMPISILTLPVMLVCSIICAVMVGKRWSTGLGILTFVGIQVVYIGVAFAGCIAAMEGVNFH